MSFLSLPACLHGIARLSRLFPTLLLACSLAMPAVAQTKSSEMLRIVVAWPPGGPTDTIARIVGQHLGTILSRPVVVENKSGAAGLIGTESVVRAAPDGNTLLMAVFQDVTRPALGARQNFDVLTDLAPLAKVYDLPFLIVVNPKVIQVGTLQGLIAYARKHPLMYATSSNGSMGHLSFELIAQTAGINVQHVPYKGGAPALTDLLGGQVPMMYADIRTVLPHIRSGKLKALAVGNPSRIPALPDVPTVAESGFPGFVGTAWGGLMVPARTPAKTRAELADALAKTMASPEVAAKVRELGAEAASPASPADFGKFMAAESEKWSAIIRARGIRAE